MPARRPDTTHADPAHPRAREIGRGTPTAHSESKRLPGEGGWLRSVSNVPDQPLPKSRRGWSGTTPTLHHPPKNKDQSQDQDQDQSQTHQWYRSSRTCGPNRPAVRAQQRVQAKPAGGGRSPRRHGEGSQSPESPDGVLKLQDVKLVPEEPQLSLQRAVEVVGFFEQDRDRQLHLPYVV